MQQINDSEKDRNKEQKGEREREREELSTLPPMKFSKFDIYSVDY